MAETTTPTPTQTTRETAGVKAAATRKTTPRSAPRPPRRPPARAPPTPAPLLAPRPLARRRPALARPPRRRRPRPRTSCAPRSPRDGHGREGRLRPGRRGADRPRRGRRHVRGPAHVLRQQGQGQAGAAQVRAPRLEHRQGHREGRQEDPHARRARAQAAPRPPREGAQARRRRAQGRHRARQEEPRARQARIENAYQTGRTGATKTRPPCRSASPRSSDPLPPQIAALQFLPQPTPRLLPGAASAVAIDLRAAARCDGVMAATSIRSDARRARTRSPRSGGPAARARRSAEPAPKTQARRSRCPASTPSPSAPRPRRAAPRRAGAPADAERAVKPGRAVRGLVVALVVVAIAGGAIASIVGSGVDKVERFVDDFTTATGSPRRRPLVVRGPSGREQPRWIRRAAWPRRPPSPARRRPRLAAAPVRLRRRDKRLRNGGYGRLANLRVAPERIDATCSRRAARCATCRSSPAAICGSSARRARASAACRRCRWRASTPARRSVRPVRRPSGWASAEPGELPRLHAVRRHRAVERLLHGRPDLLGRRPGRITRRIS